jgi:hypothetical protein
MVLAVGDYDNDGYVDVLEANARITYLSSMMIPRHATNRVYRNRGDGTFELIDTDDSIGYTEYTHAGAAAWVDYDNDGWLDAAFQANGGAGSTSASGGVDVVIPELRSVELYRNDQSGGFVRAYAGELTETVRNTLNMGCFEWADFDGDGWVDVFSHEGLYRNNNSVFYRVDQKYDEMGGTAWIWAEQHDYNKAAWGDFDGDGDVDLVIFLGDSSNPGERALYENVGWYTAGDDNATYYNFTLFTFDSVAANGVSPNGALKTVAIQWGDFNGDGHLDLFCAIESASTEILINNGDKTFTQLEAGAHLTYEYDSVSMALADLDEDGGASSLPACHTWPSTHLTLLD